MELDTNAVPNSCAWQQQGGFTTRTQKEESRKEEIQNDAKWTGKQEAPTVSLQSSGLPSLQGRHERTN